MNVTPPNPACCTVFKDVLDDAVLPGTDRPKTRLLLVRQRTNKPHLSYIILVLDRFQWTARPSPLAINRNGGGCGVSANNLCNVSEVINQRWSPPLKNRRPIVIVRDPSILSIKFSVAWFRPRKSLVGSAREPVPEKATNNMTQTALTDFGQNL